MNLEGSELDRMRAVEDAHWWYCSLRAMAVREALRVSRRTPEPQVLDAGCGTGAMMAALSLAIPQAEITGADIHPRAIELARERSVGRVVEASTDRLPFEDNSFELVLSLDVLYIDSVNEVVAARELARVMKKNSTLLLNLPAFNFLRGEHDRAIRTARRYTKNRVRALVEKAGLSVEKIFYWNTALFPFMAVWRPLTRALSAGKASPRSDLSLPGILNGPLSALVGLETRLDARLPIPFGSSVFAVVRK